MSKKSKEKNKNLKSSLLVLLLIAILLIASTYAWFTANRTVTISSLEVNVQASNGLQISTDAEDWKAVITRDDILTGAYDGNTNKIPTSMTPVSTDGSVTGANMNMFYGVMAPDEDTGRYALTATQETDSTTDKYIVFDIFLKADEAMDLTLTGESAVTTKEGSTDKGLQNASRVAFINEGNVATTAGAAAATVLDDAKPFSDGDRSTVIWEPNAGSHTAEAVANNPYGTDAVITAGDSGAPVQYYGVKTAIADPIDRTTINSGDDDTHFALMTGAGLTTTNKDASETADFIHIDAGITKIRVYMWVEGQDVDCDNSASGTDIVFNVQFDAPEGVGG